MIWGRHGWFGFPSLSPSPSPSPCPSHSCSLVFRSANVIRFSSGISIHSSPLNQKSKLKGRKKNNTICQQCCPAVDTHTSNINETMSYHFTERPSNAPTRPWKRTGSFVQFTNPSIHPSTGTGNPHFNFENYLDEAVNQRWVFTKTWIQIVKTMASTAGVFSSFKDVD